jgi:hypothetical protein
MTLRDPYVQTQLWVGCTLCAGGLLCTLGVSLSLPALLCFWVACIGAGVCLQFVYTHRRELVRAVITREAAHMLEHTCVCGLRHESVSVLLYRSLYEFLSTPSPVLPQMTLAVCLAGVLSEREVRYCRNVHVYVSVIH